MANSGSISVARLKSGSAALAPLEKCSFNPASYALRASIDVVVASARGVLCFLTVADDSPIRVLNLLAIRVRAFSKLSLRVARSC